MKRVIDGRVYNTETATHICRLRCYTDDATDFGWHRTGLFKSPKGAYFIAGEGGPRSLWAETTEGGPIFPGGSSGGSGMRLVDVAEAAEIAEAAELDAEQMKAAGFPVEEG